VSPGRRKRRSGENRRANRRTRQFYVGRAKALNKARIRCILRRTQLSGVRKSALSLMACKFFSRRNLSMRCCQPPALEVRDDRFKHGGTSLDCSLVAYYSAFCLNLAGRAATNGGAP
jgi:hypothetical protein